jgi:hypothetical protein
MSGLKVTCTAWKPGGESQDVCIQGKNITLAVPEGVQVGDQFEVEIPFDSQTAEMTVNWVLKAEVPAGQFMFVDVGAQKIQVRVPDGVQVGETFRYKWANDGSEPTIEKITADAPPAAPPSGPAGIGAAMASMEITSAIGSHDNPISTQTLVSVAKPLLEGMKNMGGQRYCKVVPTMVLFPTATEGSFDGQVPQPIMTLLKLRDGTQLEETRGEYRNKCALLNFCTPSVEVYQKPVEGKGGCKDIYDWEAVEAQVVPETSKEECVAYLNRFVEQGMPINANRAMSIELVAERCEELRRCLGRGGMPWRIAFNRRDVTLVAHKLTHDDMQALLREAGHTGPYDDKPIYREHTRANPSYGFAVGDYIVADIDPSTDDFKPDKKHPGLPLVRTINGKSFEATYNKIA